MQPLVFQCANYVYTQVPRTDVLYCLHTQAGSSLMVQEKQMPPSVSLVFLLDPLYHIPQLQKITHFVTISLIFSHPALPLLKHPLYKPVSEKRRGSFPEAVLKRSCLLPTGSALTGLLF